MGCGGSKQPQQQQESKALAAEAGQENKQSEATLLPEKKEPEQKKAEEPKGPAVKVKIVGATGLRNADWVLTSEPYCAVQLFSPKPASRLQTKTHEDYKNPAWNTTLEVPGYTAGDALSITIKDKDLNLDDILGKVVLTDAQVKQGFTGELQLTETGGCPDAKIKVKVEAMGTAMEGVEKAVEAVKELVTGKESVEAEAAECRNVKVEIERAMNLRNADWVKTSEPYCIVELLGPKPESKAETKTDKENYKNPAWNTTLEVPGYTAGDALSITIKDKDLKSDDILGKVVLTDAQVKQGFTGELQLTETGGCADAKIKVEVDAMGTIAAKVEEAVEEIKKEVEEAIGGGPAVVESEKEATKSTGCCM